MRAAADPPRRRKRVLLFGAMAALVAVVVIVVVLAAGSSSDPPAPGTVDFALAQGKAAETFALSHYPGRESLEPQDGGAYAPNCSPPDGGADVGGTVDCDLRLKRDTPPADAPPRLNEPQATLKLTVTSNDPFEFGAVAAGDCVYQDARGKSGACP